MKPILLIIVSVVLASCANPARELKAPCKGLSNFAPDSSCGPLKPANAAIETIMAE